MTPYFLDFLKLASKLFMHMHIIHIFTSKSHLMPNATVIEFDFSNVVPNVLPTSRVMDMHTVSTIYA